MTIESRVDALIKKLDSKSHAIEQGLSDLKTQRAYIAALREIDALRKYKKILEHVKTGEGELWW